MFDFWFFNSLFNKLQTQKHEIVEKTAIDSIIQAFTIFPNNITYHLHKKGLYILPGAIYCSSNKIPEFSIMIFNKKNIYYFNVYGMPNAHSSVKDIKNHITLNRKINGHVIKLKKENAKKVYQFFEKEILINLVADDKRPMSNKEFLTLSYKTNKEKNTISDNYQRFLNEKKIKEKVPEVLDAYNSYQTILNLHKDH